MYLLYVLCTMSFKNQQTNFFLLNTICSEDVSLLCHEGWPALISARWYSRFQALHLPIMAPKCHGRALVGGCGAVPNWANCSALFSVLLTQGLVNPGLAPSHMVKWLTEGWGTLMSLPPTQVLPWERLVERWLCGCFALAEGHCSWDKGMHTMNAWFITILEKHNSEMCKPLKSSVISFTLTENRFLADFFFSLAVLNFSLKMRRRKASLQGEGQAETLQIKMRAYVIHHSSDLQSALNNTTSYYLEP